jgi:formylglycine-generating enzyme
MPPTQARAVALALAPVLVALAALAACSTAPMPPPAEVIIEASARTACPDDERWSGGRCVPEPPAPPPAVSSGCPHGTAFIEGGKLAAGEKPPVAVRSICMDVTEVTVGAYEACVTRGRCDHEGLVGTDTDCNYGKSGRHNHPINCVSWEQADRYCRAAGERLPSVEEWSWAAQGGKRRLKRPWGGAPAGDQLCWGPSHKGSGTCAVGSFRSGRSPQGIDDLYGNVWEWASPKMRGGIANVNRGGGWGSSDEEEIAMEGAGNFQSDFVRNDVVGFRCVADAPAGLAE